MPDSGASTKLPWSDTHPFLTFTFRSNLNPQTWAMLGECSSKIEHVARVAMRPDTAKDILTIFLVKGVHGTTAIEGNTLSEEDVRKRVEGRLQLPASQEYLGTEIDNVVKAHNWIIQQIALGAPAHFGRDDVRELNRMVLESLDVAAHVVPGEFRETSVTVGDYLAPNARYVPEMIDRLCRWMNGDAWTDAVGAPFVLPILKAILSHLYIAWIHPFGDGNGRTARLIEFDVLTRVGVPIISAHVLSDHYNRTRGAYYRALSNARRDPVEFVRYAVQGCADGLREQIDRIWQQQTQVTWINYVHERFRKHAHSKTNSRRRDVAIALGIRNEPIAWNEIPLLDPNLTVAYANGRRRLQRDLTFLYREGLITGELTGMVKANTELLRTFLPFRNPAAEQSAG